MGENSPKTATPPLHSCRKSRGFRSSQRARDPKPNGRETRDCLQQRWTIFHPTSTPFPSPHDPTYLFKSFQQTILHLPFITHYLPPPPFRTRGCKRRYPKTPVPNFHTQSQFLVFPGFSKNVSLLKQAVFKTRPLLSSSTSSSSFKSSCRSRSLKLC